MENMTNIPKSIRDAIDDVLNYLWDDEYVHYVFDSRDLDDAGDAHIFGSLVEIERWLYPKSTDTFGACPHCNQHDGHLHGEHDRWFVCHLHRCKWPAEEVASCRNDWECNVATLHEYTEIEPVYRRMFRPKVGAQNHMRASHDE